MIEGDGSGDSGDRACAPAPAMDSDDVFRIDDDRKGGLRGGGRPVTDLESGWLGAFNPMFLMSSGWNKPFRCDCFAY